ncbi:hypothetical protein ABPG72_017277 [Tetrahymena utriculariae]
MLETLKSISIKQKIQYLDSGNKKFLQKKNNIFQMIFKNQRPLKSISYMQKNGANSKFIQRISQELNKSLDIYEFYKDIVWIEKSIMMILSEDYWHPCSLSVLQKNILVQIYKAKIKKLIFQVINQFINQIQLVLNCLYLQKKSFRINQIIQRSDFPFYHRMSFNLNIQINFLKNLRKMQHQINQIKKYGLQYLKQKNRFD